MEYLDFEQPIKELDQQLEKCQNIGEESDVDVTQTCNNINKRLEVLKALLRIYILNTLSKHYPT